MDTQKSPASRIRQILAAMERSIDVARSRRVNVHSNDPGSHSTATPLSSSMHPDSPLVGRTEVSPAAPPASRINQVIGGSSVVGASPSAPTPPSIPGAAQSQPRLKARPKRFDGAFPTPFPQPAYRSQTG